MKSKGHTPSYYEGVLWLAKTYAQRQQYSSAEYLFNSLGEDKKVPKSIKRQIPLAKTEMYLHQKNMDQALKSLADLIENTKDRKLKTRYTFIRGQIYSFLGEPGQALAEFEKAKRLKPNFEMAFNSDLNKIMLRNQVGSISQDEALRQLDKMAKEEKYKQQAGQVYYAKGTVRLESGDFEGAIAELKNSVYYNASNIPQKTESYLKLAQLYFQADEFATSKYYYDSTLMLMPKTDLRYVDVNNYAESLASIAKNIEIMQTQDSLIALSRLSEEELRDYAIQTLEERGTQQQAPGTTEPNRPSGPSPSTESR